MMTRCGRFWRCLLGLTALSLSSACMPEDRRPTHLSGAIQERRIVLDTAALEQEFQGFGTSLCWFANLIGGWTPKVKNAIADLLFDRDKGLGFNIVRYNIGGGDNPSHHHLRPGGDVPGFWPAASAAYDWRQDANQRWFLQAAIDRGVQLTEAFSNSPPWWMTVSQCSAGAARGWANNLRDDAYEIFADYLASVVQHFQDVWHIQFNSLEPLNESSSYFWHAFGNQEGAHFDTNSQSRLYELLTLAMQRHGVTATRLVANDDSNMEDAARSFLNFSATAQQAIQRLNVHAYSGSDREFVRRTAYEHGKQLWMSEVDDPGGSAYNPRAITPGLVLARQIIRDLKYMRPHAWVFWQAVEDGINMQPDHENKNWGLIHADMQNGSQNYSLTKKYFAMAQFSRFIGIGSHMMTVDDADSVAFLNHDGRQLTWVQINENSSTKSLNLAVPEGFQQGLVQVIQTSADFDLAPVTDWRWLDDGSLQLAVAPLSITTVALTAN